MGAAVAGPCRPLSGQHATGQRVRSHARNGGVLPCIVVDQDPDVSITFWLGLIWIWINLSGLEQTLF
jgi:hypothetical protein